jgi:hypothetical protein
MGGKRKNPFIIEKLEESFSKMRRDGKAWRLQDGIIKSYRIVGFAGKEKKFS